MTKRSPRQAAGSLHLAALKLLVGGTEDVGAEEIITVHLINMIAGAIRERLPDC
ncbi:hypothetical protein [Bradyrhizobium sp. 147]|uniref:hypothetical protein n=1 Tax=Bradyrhizobium sp. 147 TaxID=2782623 RepID=UPI001FFC09CF|nr:hypothetical protein [Bradyrhizobium sp. 147]